MNWFKRAPNLIIGSEARTYLRRWYLIPRNRFFNVYLHHFCASDNDRALHDHPWVNLSILLRGSYVEHRLGNRVTRRSAPALVLRRPATAHRIELDIDLDGMPQPVWTLFITGPRVRDWGFLCPQGWRHWRDFTAGEHGETVGKGCD
jgi:hypothetical protein